MFNGVTVQFQHFMAHLHWHGTVQYGTLNFSNVNRYRSELKRTEPGQFGPANPTMLARYGTVQ